MAVDVAATPAVSSIAVLFLSSNAFMEDACTSIEVAYFDTTVTEHMAISKSKTITMIFFYVIFSLNITCLLSIRSILFVPVISYNKFTIK